MHFVKISVLGIEVDEESGEEASSLSKQQEMLSEHFINQVSQKAQ